MPPPTTSLNTPLPSRPPSLILAGPDGRSTLDPRRKGERAGWLRASDYPLNIKAGVAGPTAFYVPSSGSGDFQASHLVATSTAPFTTELKYLAPGGTGWDLQNKPIHHNLMFGLAEAPFRLAEPLLMEAGTGLQLRATSLATSITLALRAVIWGRYFSNEMDPNEQKAAVDPLRIATKKSRPFWLTLDKTSFSLTALQVRAEFLMSMPNGFSLVLERPPLVESTGPFQIEMSDRNDGRSLTPDGPIDSQLMAVRGEYAEDLFTGLVLNPGQTIKVQLTDTSGAANVGYVTLHGRAVPCGP